MIPVQFSGAIVRGISPSLLRALRLHQESEPISIENALQQHEAYFKTLRRVVDQLIEIPADDAYPDCCFVEDTCVCVDGVALIPQLGHPSRRGEVGPVAAALEKLGWRTVHMTGAALLDGGDVLYTGREFFVGLSKRTNTEGIATLAATFPAYRVTPIVVEEALHLKSCCSLAAPDIIAVGGSAPSQAVRNSIEAAAKGVYKFITFESDAAANCVFVNNFILHRPIREFADVIKYAELGFECIEVANDELAKVDGALTCCSVLLQNFVQ